MSRRTTPRKKIDELAFPVRLLISQISNTHVFDDLHTWLNVEVGQGDYAVHSATGIGAHPMGIYLRDLQSADALFRAFPSVELEDGTQSIAYSTPAHWSGSEVFGVCNLYSQVKGPSAIREVTKAMIDEIGNAQPLTGIFPDQMAPVVRNTEAGRCMSMLRWGMPSPKFALKNRNTDSGITNVRNTASPHWRRWLNVKSRCVVPFTSFCEYDVTPGRNKEPVWFALSEDRPLAFFAGIWTQWTSVRKLKDGETTDNLFGFLTCDANALVGEVHPKAMPVILTGPDEIETWLSAPMDEALQLQRPLADDALMIVGRGSREDTGD